MTITSFLAQYSDYLIGLLASVFLGIAFVKLVLYFFSPSGGEEGLRHGGMIVGFFERVIITILVFVGEYNAIAFVLTAKTITRFEQLKDRDFAEYYLIGTLSSVAFAIISGLIAIYVM